MEPHTATLIGSMFGALMIAVPATIHAIAKLREVSGGERKAQAVTAEATGAVEAKSETEADLRAIIRANEATITGQERYIRYLEQHGSQRLPPEASS